MIEVNRQIQRETTSTYVHAVFSHEGKVSQAEAKIMYEGNYKIEIIDSMAV
jgi:hypothetical protein